MIRSRTEKLAACAVFVALAMILSYVESLVPYFFAVPGMKLGLTNLVVVYTLYLFGNKEAFIINIVRIILVGFMFGHAFSIIYSMAGGILSFVVMYFLKKTNGFSVMGVSMAGGVFHNVGQILVAALVLKSFSISWYLPPLMISGLITGFLIGIISNETMKRTAKLFREKK
ncbi:MAG: Gx transporter family protein [Lachnospiraceae bacterium]|nr:Gx transporter family protein [Lachnospiraceae bacterium]